MKLLEHQVVLVTGGSRGIGKAIVLECASQGAHVAFTFAGSTDRAAAVKAEVEALGVKCLAIQADAADTEKAQAVMDQVLAELGGLHTVINNAGITRDNLLLRLSEAQWDEVLATNLKSVFNYTKAATKPMMRNRGGTILNIGSVVGVGGNAGQANYAASKAGVIGFTKSVAKELGSRNIRANVIAPGFIATEMTEQIPEKELNTWLEGIPLKRAGQPEEVAKLCSFLASDHAAYITGQVIRIDGGMS